MPPPLEPKEIEQAVKDLRRSRAPEAVWDRVVHELRQPVAPPGVSVLLRPVRSPLVAALAAVAAVVAGTWIGLYRLYHAPDRWDVVALAGSPTVDGGTITGPDRIAAGQWLVTDSSSSAQLDVGRIGTAEVGPSSRVRMESGNGFAHRLTLERGSLNAIITAPPRLFFVQTPTAIATDLGCAYTLRVDDAGNTHIHVTAGWVELKQNGRVSLVPAGLTAEVEAGIGPGTPHPLWLTDSARATLRRLDRAGVSTDDLERILDELDTSAPSVTLRKERAITLWHLVQRVSGGQRVLVYERLQVLSPAPEGVTREGILALERPMLERWRRDLNPLWSEEAQPFMVRWARQLWDWTVR